MATPVEIAADLIRGQAYYSMLNAERIKDMMNGCVCDCSCDESLWACLGNIIKSLQWRTDLGVYDSITDKLYIDMLLIIGNTPETVMTKVYYTLKTTSAPLTEAEILDLPFIEIPVGSNPVITYGALNPPRFALMAEASTEPLKTKWEDTVVDLNAGNIGSPTDLFGAPIIVGSLRVYQTEYQTQFEFPIRFKVS